MMPALLPGGRFFFDPALDPVWATCVEVGLPISQHGGSGAPAYAPPGFAAIMTLALEHSFYSGRSLWQMILGGVFERFPELRVAFVETEADWIAPVSASWIVAFSGATTGPGGPRRCSGCVSSAVRPVSTGRPTASPASRHSPRTRSRSTSWRVPTAEYEQFAIGCDNTMFGVDYPHFESVFPDTKHSVDALVQHPSITAEVSRKILCENAAARLRLRLGRLLRPTLSGSASRSTDRTFPTVADAGHSPGSVQTVAPGDLPQPARRRFDRPCEICHGRRR